MNLINRIVRLSGSQIALLVRIPLFYAVLTRTLETEKLMIARKLALSATMTLTLTFTGMAAADGDEKHDHGNKATSGDITATVNDEPISSLLADRVAEQLAAQGQQPNRAQIIDELINLEILTQEAEKIELDKNNEVATALHLQYTQTMANAYLADFSNELEITEEDIRAEYEKQIADLKVSEYNASHILVETEDEAKKIIEELKAGGNFAELAKTHSTGPTGTNGGDLGWFQPENMVAEFSDALSTLEVGNTTGEPVKTQFGWHIIQLNETRAAAKPDYSPAVKSGIQNTLLRQALSEHVQALRDKAAIEIIEK